MIFVFLLIVVSAGGFGGSSFRYGSASALAAGAPVEENDWKEQDEFHEVMAQTFHPMEKGNFEPVRKRAGELAAKAKTWSKSKPPKALDTPKIKDTLKKLADESAALSRMVSKKASDEEIRKALTALHDRFHEVVGLCSESH